jgi:hypothetical protein
MTPPSGNTGIVPPVYYPPGNWMWVWSPYQGWHIGFVPPGNLGLILPWLLPSGTIPGTPTLPQPTSS